MATTWTVQADTEVEVRRELARLCAALGLVPVGRPMLLPGREGGRWMARAARLGAGVRAVREVGHA